MVRQDQAGIQALPSQAGQPQAGACASLGLSFLLWQPPSRVWP